MKSFLCGIGLLILGCALAHGQTQEKLLYTFCQLQNCADGYSPEGNLVMDKQGNIYGGTYGGGVCGPGYGTIFELSPMPNGTWTESVLHNFGASTNCQNNADGAEPYGLILDATGNLYGVTRLQGPNGYGSVFELSPPSSPGGAWTFTTLWSFDYNNGGGPQGKLIFDAAGNLYDTTAFGGTQGGGTVFQLIPPTSGEQWSLNTLYSFVPNSSSDGNNPLAGVVFDAQGNLYGNTQYGGQGIGYRQPGWGIVYKLTPTSQPPWTESILYEFLPRTGVNPESELAIDPAGNLYGAVPSGGSSHDGAVFKLAPGSGGNYQFSEFAFTGAPTGSEPVNVVLANGALYGATQSGGANQNVGTVFRLNAQGESVLYNFCSLSNCSDGATPEGDILIHNGSLFGIVFGGTTGNNGGIYQINR